MLEDVAGVSLVQLRASASAAPRDLRRFLPTTREEMAARGWDELDILIVNGDAYVDDLSPEEIRAYRGTLTEAGRNSPYRERTPEVDLADRRPSSESAREQPTVF